MNLVQNVQELFQEYPFGAPAMADDLRRAELALGEPIPPILRDLYLAFDGFRGPTDAPFFWPLFAENGLVNFNGFLREGEEFPNDFVSSCIFFGGDGTGAMWGIKRDLPDTVILWDAEWEDYEVVGTTPLDGWAKRKHDYDSIADE